MDLRLVRRVAVIVAGMPLLELTVERAGDVVRLVLEGELDISSAARVEREIALLEDQAPPVLVLDLRGLAFMDSTGLRIVVSANARAEQAQRRLVIVRGPEAVQRIFRITRLEERLEMVADPGQLETA
jgi:anti-anti-sigma factor